MGAKKHIPIVNYPGELGEPHVRIKPESALVGLLSMTPNPKSLDERETDAHRKNLEALAKKLVLLAEHYKATEVPAGLDWKKLAIELAFAHVPGFQTIDAEPRKRGRPGGGFFNFELYAAVLEVLDEGESSVANACRTLAKRKGPWSGKNPASLETRFHESRRRAAMMDLRPHMRNPETGLPLGSLAAASIEIEAKPSAKYPPVPFRLSGLFGLGASALYDHEKS